MACIPGGPCKCRLYTRGVCWRPYLLLVLLLFSRTTQLKFSLPKYLASVPKPHGLLLQTPGLLPAMAGTENSRQGSEMPPVPRGTDSCLYIHTEQELRDPGWPGVCRHHRWVHHPALQRRNHRLKGLPSRPQSRRDPRRLCEPSPARWCHPMSRVGTCLARHLNHC